MNAFIEKVDIKLGPQGTTPYVTEEKPAWRQEQQRTFGKHWEWLNNLPPSRRSASIQNGTRSIKCVLMNRPISLLTAASGAPVATAAGAEMLGIAVEQSMGSAVMLPQEKRNWPGGRRGQSVLSGYELHTDIDPDTAVAIPRDFACDVSEKVYQTYTFVVMFCAVWGSGFVVTVMSPKMICGRC